MSTAAADPRRNVPRTDVVLADPRLEPALHGLGSQLVKEHVVAALARVRADDLPADEVKHSIRQFTIFPARI